MSEQKPRGFIRSRKIQGGTRYYAYVMFHGRERSVGGFSSKERAKTALRTAEGRIADGSFGIKKETKSSPTFAEFYEHLMKAKSKSLKPSTRRDYEITFRLYVLPYFEDKPLDEIEPIDVQRWVDSLKRKRPTAAKKDLSPASVAKTYRYFRAAMRKAAEWKLVPESPCRGIILPRCKQDEPDFLEPPEIALLLGYLEEPWRTCTAVLAYTGMRTGEVRGLRWRDINFDNHEINVVRSWNKYNGFDSPKSAASRRAVPMLPHVDDILREYYQRYNAPSPDTLLFFADDKPLDLRRRFETALKEAGLKHVNIHSLRHGFASLLLSNGVSIKAVQRCLGHGSAALTLGTYSHMMKDDLGSAALRVNAAIAETGGQVIDIKQQEAVL